MKSIPLRMLLRDPVKVKRMTRSGKAVRVTDNGKPLWVLQPEKAPVSTEQRTREIDRLLDEVLQETPSSFPLSKIILESR